MLLDGFEVTRRNKSSGKPKVRTKLQRLSLELEAAKTKKSVVKLFVAPHVMAGSLGSGGSRSSASAVSMSSISLGSVSIPPTVITSTSLPDPCKQALLIHLPKVSKYAANIRQSLTSQKQYTGEGTYDDFHNFRQALVIGIKSVCPEVLMCLAEVPKPGDEYFAEANDFVYQIIWSLCTSKARRLITPFESDSDGRRALLTLASRANPQDIFSINKLERAIADIKIDGTADPSIAITQLRMLSGQLSAAGQPQDDVKLQKAIIGALGSSYSQYLTSLTTSSGKTFTDSYELVDEIHTHWSLNHAGWAKGAILAADQQRAADAASRAELALKQTQGMVAALFASNDPGHAAAAAESAWYDGSFLVFLRFLTKSFFNFYVKL